MQVAADRWLVMCQAQSQPPGLQSQAPGCQPQAPGSQSQAQGSQPQPSGSQALWSQSSPLSLAESDFSITDVTGKWREIRVSAPSRALASTADVEELLAGRICARTALFDCPAILQRLNEGYAVWIERSYEHAFNIAIQQAASL